MGLSIKESLSFISQIIIPLGFNAEYIVYYLQCLATGKIIAVVVINKHQVGGVSTRLEPEACRLALEFLENQGIKIE